MTAHEPTVSPEEHVAAIEYRVLGPIEVVVDGEAAPVGGHTAMALTAALVIGADHAIPDDYLVHVMWGDEPPPTATASLHSHLSRLRAVVGHDAIEGHEGSHRLVAAAGQIDACRFERRVKHAGERLASEPEQAREEVRSALALWRGPPFGELADSEFCRLEVERLHELRLGAEDIEIAADLRLGRLLEATSLLAAAVVDQPYRERRWHDYMSALAVQGRRTEALRAFERLSRHLAEVGLTPSAECADLAAAIASDEVRWDGTDLPAVTPGRCSAA